MNRKVLITIAALVFPLAMVVLVVITKWNQPSSQERRVIMLFDYVKDGQSSRDFDRLTNTGPVAVSVLQKSLGSPQSADQRKAAWIWGQMGQAASPAIPDLIKTCGTNYFFPVRMAAIEALMNLDTTEYHEQILGEFLPLLNDPHPGIQNTAVNVLNKIEADRKTHGLQSLITNEVEYAAAFAQSPASRVRLMGLGQLMHLPEHNEQALKAITNLTHDEDQLIAQQAKRFIEQFGTNPLYPPSRMRPGRSLPLPPPDGIQFHR